MEGKRYRKGRNEIAARRRERMSMTGRKNKKTTRKLAKRAAQKLKN